MTVKLNKEDIKKDILGRPFRSRKNHVFKFRREGDIFVAKIFSEEFRSRALNEYNILRDCTAKNVDVPKPVEFENDIIIMEYLEGENASDYFERTYGKWTTSIKKKISSSQKPPKELVVFCDKLANWLARFHRAFDNKIARGDSILRNFTIKDKKIYGLDFEEAAEKDPLNDLGNLCAYILGLRPAFTSEKLRIVKIISEKYWHHSGNDRSAELPGFIAGSLEHYGQFRSDQKLLKDEAKRLRGKKDGL